MSEMTRERVDVPNEFWLAYDQGDLDEAGRILGEDLSTRSEYAAKESCDDSFLYQHIGKYVSEDLSLVEESIRVTCVDWDDGSPSGDLNVSFEESRYWGCPDIDREDVQGISLRFGINGTTPGSRYVWVEVLESSVVFSRD
jgi:hypothetical protein